MTLEPNRKQRTHYKGGPYVKHKIRAFEWSPSRVEYTHGLGGGFFTNIRGSHRMIREMYGFPPHDNSHACWPEHSHLLRAMNKALKGDGAVLKSGRGSDGTSHFYVEFIGRRAGTETNPHGVANIRKAKSIARKVAIIASEYPYIIEPATGDISGEGDYVTTLVVWKE